MIIMRGDHFVVAPNGEYLHESLLPVVEADDDDTTAPGDDDDDHDDTATNFDIHRQPSIQLQSLP
jgi:hypothetical protein